MANLPRPRHKHAYHYDDSLLSRRCHFSKAQGANLPHFFEPLLSFCNSGCRNANVTLIPARRLHKVFAAEYPPGGDVMPSALRAGLARKDARALSRISEAK
jgi:hypothetical protein